VACENCAGPIEGVGVSRGRFCSTRCYRAAWARAKRQADPAAYREEMRQRRANPEFRERQRESNRRSSANRREQIAERQRDWARRNPEKARAERAARKAVERGKLVREPCLFCGASKVHAHHHDYSQPLAVTWLCPQHHGLVHRKVA
jgi:hypothetical protein